MNHDLVLAASVITGWEAGRIVSRLWIIPWIEHRLGVEQPAPKTPGETLGAAAGSLTEWTEQAAKRKRGA